LLAAERNCAHDNAREAHRAIVEAICRDLTTGMLFSGLQQPADVSSARAWSADQSQAALRAALAANPSRSDGATSFQAGDNQLTSLPAEIGQLALLEYLYVRKLN
jgi:hypothetical protein